jgi:hypothetical protein
MRAMLLAVDQPEEALRLASEALTILLPAFETIPEPHADVMQGIVGLYLQAAENVGVEPDRDLLGRAMRALQSSDSSPSTA